jgi:phosphate starvation-inducible PhoH-like protein
MAGFVGTEKPFQQTLTLSARELLGLLGPAETNRPHLEKTWGVEIHTRGGEITFSHPEREPVDRAADRARHLLRSLTEGEVLSARQIDWYRDADTGSVPVNTVVTGAMRQTIRVKTPGQANFYTAVQRNDLVFAIGPAGTGKTYLAVALAIEALRRKLIDSIYLVRPAVEAGETLGYLPGTFREKVDPYLQPLYDAIKDMVTREQYQTLFSSGVIEIAPLAYMRGRTLNNAYVILDEAQNTTLSQMKMFLTRMGTNSKAIITGDVTQVDLKHKEESGLLLITEVLQGVPNIAFVHLDSRDVVRHPLVRDIIEAFSRYDQRHGSENKI